MLSPHIQWALDDLKSQKEGRALTGQGGPSITINKLTGTAGAFYEKIRYLVDYKDEHTIRRSAIQRIVKRRLLLEGGARIGLPLLQELVSSGYLANKVIPEGAARDIQSIIDKYLMLGSGALSHATISSLIASEIERLFFPQPVNDLVAEAFYRTVIEHIKYKGAASMDTLRTQTYIACRRNLFEEDHDALLYALLIKYIPELPEADRAGAVELKSRFIHVIRAAQRQLESQLGWRLASKLKNHSIYFSVIKELIKKYGAVSEVILTDHARMQEEIKSFLDDKYKRQAAILNKSGLRAVMYILITKTLVALALELPYEAIFLSSIDYTALATNIVFHPLLLWIMVKTAPFSSTHNTRLVIKGVEQAASGHGIDTVYLKTRSDNPFLLFIFSLFYGVLFTVSFGGIIWALHAFHFNGVSIALFMFFLTLVSYFGFRIRYNAKKWRVSTGDEGLAGLLWNFITTPIVRTGRSLSRQFSSVNVFVFIMDFILEMPFKFILGTFDSFMSFLKEKGDDAY